MVDVQFRSSKDSRYAQMIITKEFKLELCMLFWMSANVSDSEALKKIRLLIRSQSEKMSDQELLTLRKKIHSFRESL